MARHALSQYGDGSYADPVTVSESGTTTTTATATGSESFTADERAPIYGRGAYGQAVYAAENTVSETATTTVSATVSGAADPQVSEAGVSQATVSASGSKSVTVANPNAGIYSRGRYGQAQHAVTSLSVSETGTTTASTSVSGASSATATASGASTATASATASNVSLTTASTTTATATTTRPRVAITLSGTASPTAAAGGTVRNVIRVEDLVTAQTYGGTQYGSAIFGTPAAASEATATASGSLSNLALSDAGSSTATASASAGPLTLGAVGTASPTASASAGEIQITLDSEPVVASATSSGVVTFPVLPSGTSLYIDRLKRDRYAIASAVVSEYPDIARGETATFEVRIDGDDRQPRSEAYNRLKDLETYAGFAQTGRTLSDVYFSETASYADEPIDTLLLRIEPGDKIDAPGVWGVVESIEDSTQVLATGGKLTLEVFVIDRLSEYADQQAVRNDVEV